MWIHLKYIKILLESYLECPNLVDKVKGDIAVNIYSLGIIDVEGGGLV